MTKKYSVTVILLLLFFSKNALSICSHDPKRHDPQKGDPKGQWVIQEENDALAIDHGSDQAYTQGLRISFSFDTECEPKFAFKLGRNIRNSILGKLTGIGDEWEYEMLTTLGLGQHMFTPNDISKTELIENDRPYGAYLYGSARYDFTEVPKNDFGEYSHEYLNGHFYGQTQQTFEFQLGWIGPSAQGEWAQATVHELIDDEEPMGWDNQLPDELGVFAKYTLRHRFAHLTKRKDEEGEHVSYDIVPHTSIALGNVQNYASVGLMVRYGKNISGFHTDGLSPVASVKDILNEIDAVCGLKIFVECYAFVGAEIRYVAHNIFLDGSLFQDSHSVDKESIVADLSAGVRFRFPWRSLTLDYAYIRRGNEFSPVPEGASRSNGDHDYGMLTAKWTSYF